jgi:cellulose synthase (UDP-forming)
LSLVLIAFAIFWRSTGTFRPYDARLFGWEGMAFIFLRWPWSLAGSLVALRDHVTGSFVDFRITPKGAQEKRAMPSRVVAPYVALSMLSALAMAAAPLHGKAEGFYIFAAMNVVIYGGLAMLVVWRHAAENGLRLRMQSRGVFAAVLATLIVFFASGTEIRRHGLSSLEALSQGQTIVSFTDTKFAVAGAGLGGGKTKIVRFHLRWHGFVKPAGEEGKTEPTA